MKPEDLDLPEAVVAEHVGSLYLRVVALERALTEARKRLEPPEPPAPHRETET